MKLYENGQNGVILATKWRHTSKLGWDMIKWFFNIIYLYYWVTSYILFVGKNKLTGSKGHISVQIDQKQSKRRLFGHKMTSYVEIGVRYDKKFFSTLPTFTTESSHIYFLGVKMDLNGSKSWKYQKIRVFPIFPI